jgi:hypothetical protein
MSADPEVLNLMLLEKMLSSFLDAVKKNVLHPPVSFERFEDARTKAKIPRMWDLAEFCLRRRFTYFYIYL